MIAGDVTRHMLATYEAGEMITMCAWCRRVEIDGEWLQAPRAALSAIDAPYTLSHSICPTCEAVPWPRSPERAAELVRVIGSAVSRR